MSACRECERERARAYNREHAEARAAYAAGYYEAHRDEKQAYNRGYKADNWSGIWLWTITYNAWRSAHGRAGTCLELGIDPDLDYWNKRLAEVKGTITRSRESAPKRHSALEIVDLELAERGLRRDELPGRGVLEIDKATDLATFVLDGKDARWIPLVSRHGLVEAVRAGIPTTFKPERDWSIFWNLHTKGSTTDKPPRSTGSGWS